MSITVQKFGGTSVATAPKILAAAQRAVDAKRAGRQVVVVVSARGHKTDELIELAKEVTDDPPAREMDMLLATGEQESVALVAMAVQKLGEPAISLTGAQIGIVTDTTHSKARIRSIATDRIRKALDAGQIVIAAGFQGVTDGFEITTLGRGGSDTTAVALAAALKAEVCEIYTDVEGVFTTDPRLVKTARKTARISYDEMLELASLGAGVMHSRSIEFAKKFRVPVLVRPSYSNGAGTLIAPESGESAAVVSGVALAKNEARVSVRDIPDRPGVMAVIFTRMAKRKIPIDMIVQNVGTDGRASVSFTVPEEDMAETLTAANEALQELGAGAIDVGTNLSKVSAVGSGMKTHSGVAAQMFTDLAEAGINLLMITTSDIKISVLVDRSQADLALQTVHEGFGLSRSQPGLEAGDPLPTASSEIASLPQSELEKYVAERLSNMEDIVVSEVLLSSDQSRVTLRNVPDVPGVSQQVFAANALAGVIVDIIIQNASRAGYATLSFTMPRSDLETSLEVTRKLSSRWKEAELSFERDIAVIAINGVGLRTHTGVGEKTFTAVSQAGINVQMISTSEICTSVVLDAASGQKAHECLQQAFGLK